MLTFLCALISVIRAANDSPKLNVSQLNSSISTCSVITNKDDCVHKQVLDVHTCVYCAVEDECHDVGSVFDSCSNECCASQSSVSTCKWHTPEEIKFPDGECAQASLPSNSTPFDYGDSLRYYRISATAYCSAALLQSWTCAQCKQISGFSQVAVFTKNTFQAYVAYDEIAKATTVVFRGTVGNNIKNWVADITADQIAPYSDKSIKVHDGFYKVWKLLSPMVLAELKQRSTLLPLRITGHSLGASVGVLAAKDLTDLGYRVDRLYNYGSPRTGNFKFHVMMKTLVPNIWRVTHHNDLVPHVPPQYLDFYHTDNEVYMAGTSGFRICDSTGEDPTCSNSCAETFTCTSVDDHLSYFGIEIGTDYC